MAKAANSIDFKQIDDVINRLGKEEKMKLFEKLEKETPKERWKNIFERVGKRAKKYAMSEDEVVRLCKEVRKKRYEKTIDFLIKKWVIFKICYIEKRC